MLMKKLLILLLLFSACSTTEDSPEQKWINSVYEQGWYWPLIGDRYTPSNDLVPFTSTGSFVGSFTPWSDNGSPRIDLPKQSEITFTLDEVNEDNTYAYYRFTYKFENENLTLYQGVFHGHLTTTKEHGIFWALINLTDPPALGENADIRAWLLETYSKDNFSHRGGSTLGLKKRGRTTTSKSTTVENNIPNNSNDPTSANTSGTIKN